MTDRTILHLNEHRNVFIAFTQLLIKLILSCLNNCIHLDPFGAIDVRVRKLLLDFVRLTSYMF